MKIAKKTCSKATKNDARKGLVNAGKTVNCGEYIKRWSINLPIEMLSDEKLQQDDSPARNLEKNVEMFQRSSN